MANKYNVLRTNEEIDNLINECIEQENAGRSKFPGMTYEQGLKDALAWAVTGDSDDYPLAD